VDNDAVTELNLLGNLGNASYRKAGDLYGIILLPESATGVDIEQARKLLIDRGASDAAEGSNYYGAWYQRNDIVEFKDFNMPHVTQVGFAFSYLSSLLSFPAISFPDCTAFGSAFRNNTAMTNFGAIRAEKGVDFSNAWHSCTALTSFPSGAKLGTSASNVNFTSAWQSSGLTSFPALDLSAGTNFNQAFFQATSLEEFGQCDFSNGSSFDLCWYYCSSLTTFPSMQLPSATSLNSTWMGCSSLTNFGKLEAPNVTVFRFTWSGSAITTIEDGTLLGTSASSVDFTSAFKNCTSLTTLPSNLDLSKGDDFQTAFQNCQSLVNFPANAFDTMGTPQDYCFLNTWLDNNALSAASVENILVSINTSGQSAPLTGPEITIKYNTATGSLSSATNTAIDSLSGKGWQVIVNNVNLSMANTYSVAFDGTDDYMSMTLPVLGNTHTLSAWFKTTASYGGPGSEGTLISYISSGGGGDDSVLSVVTNKVGWSDFTDDDQYGTSTVNDGNWHQAVVVVTATTQKIYVDGSLETTTSNSYSAGTSFSSATLGRRANAAQRFFNGNIDEVAIWNSELSATDVTAIYNGGRPVNLNVNTNGYDNSSTLVAWWRMGDNDSGTGSTVTDNSANSYNGSLVNGPTFQTTTP
jgi:hypothetical protein